jgi:S-phase kinase-associated protein 1
MLEDLGMDEDNEGVLLPSANSTILKKVIEWATYHKDDPPTPDDDENEDKGTVDISSWDADFMKIDQRKRSSYSFSPPIISTSKTLLISL